MKIVNYHEKYPSDYMEIFLKFSKGLEVSDIVEMATWEKGDSEKYGPIHDPQFKKMLVVTLVGCKWISFPLEKW